MKQTIPFVAFAVVAAMAFSVIGCGGDGGDVANCDGYCAVWAMCTTRDLDACKTDCVEFNEMSRADFSQACGDADADVNACVSALNCEQFEGWRDEVPPDSYPCKAEDDAADQICNAG
jgi:hypothetical protein